MAAAAASVTFRPIASADEELLYRVYASTRVEELAVVDWTEGQKDAFLRLQFSAQHRYYQENYRTAEFLVILDEATPVGRLYVDRWEDEIRLVDIAILPEHRGKGIGTRLLRELQEEARRAGKPLRIHVERMNRALGLYERLGFRQVEDRGVYLFLEWAPEPSAAGGA